MSPAAQPDEWAVAAYRLAVALTEVPSTEPAVAARRAMALLERAASLLDATRAPVEHARIVNAMGATWRVLGDRARAVDAFLRAASLMDGRARPVETSAAWSNLGLAQAEGGDPRSAIATFDRALDALLPSTRPPSGDRAVDDEVRRTFASTGLNRAQAILVLDDNGFSAAWKSAVATIDSALSILSEGPPEAAAPLHVGMLSHTRGLIHMRADDVKSARDAFDRSIAVFTRSAFPFQHAIASFNRGRAYEATGELVRALVDYETAAQLLDPRLHREQWHEAAKRLAVLEDRLRSSNPDARRTDHIVGLLASLSPAERTHQLRERLTRLLGLAPDLQRAEMGSLTGAAIRRGAVAHDMVLRTTLEVLMELPDELLRSALLAEFDAHNALAEEERLAAGRRLDTAIQELVLGPQRVRMRDVLYEAGWERP